MMDYHKHALRRGERVTQPHTRIALCVCMGRRCSIRNGVESLPELFHRVRFNLSHRFWCSSLLLPRCLLVLCNVFINFLARNGRILSGRSHGVLMVTRHGLTARYAVYVFAHILERLPLLLGKPREGTVDDLIVDLGRPLPIRVTICYGIEVAITIQV